MKLSMNQQDLQRAADRAHSIIQSSVPNNYEKYMLLEASENLLSLRTTSDTTEVVATCPAEVAEPGSALVDGDAFHRIARRSPPDSSIEISTNSEAKKSETGPGSRLLIQAGRTNFDISVHAKEGFPEPSKQDFKNAFRVQGSELIRIIEKTRHAAESSTDQRFYLTGIYLHITPGEGEARRLAAVATDGRRLAYASFPAPADCEGEPGLIMPQTLARALISHLDPEEEVTVAIDENRVRFSARNYTLSLVAIEGTYPDYPRVIPEGGKIEIDLHVENFRTSLDRVTAISEDDERVKILGDSKSVRLSVRTVTSESEDTVADCIASQKAEIATNARHLHDILAQIEGDRIILQVIDDRSPCILAEQVGELDTKFVVMPYRT